MFEQIQTGRIARRTRRRLLASAIAVGVCGVVQTTFAATTIILDNFTNGTAGSTLIGAKPDTTDVPNSSYLLNGANVFSPTYFNDGTTNYASVGADAGAALATGVTTTVNYQISTTYNNNFIGDTAGDLQRGDGLGFFSTVSAGVNGYHGVGNFTGIVVSPSGDVRLEQVGPQGTNEPTVNLISDFVVPNYDNLANHTLSYTANTSSGLVSNVLLDGTSIPLTDTAPLFTPGNTSYVGFTASGNAGGQTALFNNFTVATSPIVGAVPATVWNVDSSGSWNTATNWTLGVPNGVGSEADLTGAITANRDIYTDTPITVSKLVFNNSTASYAITGAIGATLSLQTSSGSAVVDVQAGTHEINLPLILASNTIFQTDATTAKLIIADPLTVNAGMKLTTTGSGAVSYLSTITLLAGASAALAGPVAANVVTVSPAAQLTISNLSGGAHSVLSVTGLNLSSGGIVDVMSNALIVHGGSFTTISGAVTTGYHSGTWTGTGITSSTAAANTTRLTALGVIQNSTNGASSGTALYSTFEGQPVSNTDVLVKYTYYGDANLDGKVDGTDYARIDNGFLQHASTWFNGDFNYDGAVNGSDYTLIDNAYNSQGAVIAASISPTASVTSELAGATASAVPEPATMGFLSLGALGLLQRRRNRAQ